MSLSPLEAGISVFFAPRFNAARSSRAVGGLPLQQYEKQTAEAEGQNFWKIPASDDETKL
jgi:hypothetical protein